MTIVKDYFEATKFVDKEYTNEEIPMEGSLPEELNGTLFRNGAGRLVHQGVTYDHPFDGDGMISKFRFEHGKVFYSNRYVRTEEFVEEEQAGKMLYRSFGTNLPGGIWKNFFKMQFKNAANTNVILHGGKLMALWEGGLPHTLDPETLETKGRDTLNGVLENNFSRIDHMIAPELPFSAHPKIDAKTDKLYNFGTAPGTKQRLVLYVVEPDGTARIDRAIPMDGLSFTHDFVLTPKGNRVFFLTPVKFDVWKAFAGLTTPVASIKVQQQKPVTIMVATEEGEEYYETDFGFVFHFAGGYEVGEDKIVVDALVMPDFPDAEGTRQFMLGETSDILQAQLLRYTINRTTKEVTKKLLTPYPAEFPNTHPEADQYRYIWGIGAHPQADHHLLSGIIKVDLEKEETLHHDLHPDLPSEPIFVPKEGGAEDEGWLLLLVYRHEVDQVELVVMDAQRLEEVAKGKLPHNISLGFHGCWVGLDD